MSLTARAQPVPSGHSVPRSVVLTGKVGESPLLSLAPGVFTLIILDAPIVREAVEVEGRTRFAVVDVGDRSVTLSPAVPLGAGERLALRVTYREGFPTRAVFLLTGQPGSVDEVVNVSRPQQTGEACRVELSATRERCEAQRKELEELKARPPALSPAAVALAGFVNKDGMRGLRLKCMSSQVGSELSSTECEELGSSTWSVVVLIVSNSGAEPWVPVWAEVTPTEGGEPRRARAVLSEQTSLPAGGLVKVAIEVEMPTRKPEAWLSAPHTLRVCNGDGSRCLVVPLVKL